ncbi:MAG TPA: diguanylate cyclase [Rubrivivax sp.]|nr:diguanylate cyclase [Rubrivivax sp.]
MRNARRGWLRSRLGAGLLMLAAWAVLPAQAAAAATAVTLDPWQGAAQLKDPDGRMSLQQVLEADARGAFEPVQVREEAVNLGFTRAAYWLRLRLSQPAGPAVALLLEVASPQLSSVSVHVPEGRDGWQSIVTGADLPFATRAYAHRHFVFPLAPAPGVEQRLYVRVQSDIGLIVPLRLWTAPDFQRHERAEYQVQAVYLGAACAMLLYNLLLFVGLREGLFLRYVLYVLSAILLLAIKGGQAAEYLSPAGLHWSNDSYYAAASLAVAALAWFSRGMLGTAEVAPGADRLLRVLGWVHLLAIPVHLTTLPESAPWSMGVFVLSLVVLLGVGVWCALRRVRAAYFYLASFVALFVGSGLTLLRTLGWVGTNAFTTDGLLLGSSLEMLLLAFALADRYHRLRVEKLQVQRDLLASQQALVQTLLDSERTLTQRVQERTQELERLNRQLQGQVHVDGLTGIANRRHFDDTLHAEWGRMMRLGQPLALLMIDLDHFKAYNDQYGHVAGDEALRTVARVLAGTVQRAGDLVARYGGEEFAVIAPNAEAGSAIALAHKACRALHDLQLPHARSASGVLTLSCGVAVAVPQPGTRAEDLLAQADAALYRAKQDGRGQAVLSDAKPNSG